ncbi:MAG: hypothetical protein ACYDCP_03410 [Thermoplasmataceae archaeon]
MAYKSFIIKASGNEAGENVISGMFQALYHARYKLIEGVKLKFTEMKENTAAVGDREFSVALHQLQEANSISVAFGNMARRDGPAEKIIERCPGLNPVRSMAGKCISESYRGIDIMWRSAR